MDAGDSNTVDKYNKTRSVKEEDQAFDMKSFQQFHSSLSFTILQLSCRQRVTVVNFYGYIVH